MNSSNSVAARALLAVGLMVGFYLLALAIAGALVYLPIAEFQYLHRVHAKLALFSLVGAGTILWSILPRRDRFDAPGPLLDAARHPKLFAELEGVARATGQALPAEVFLVGDVNAWVAQRGGVMGFMSRPVMGLGLPLLQSLSVTELRAVLAHEFGHYHGGDTRLGPWVYKTRQAIGRTLAGLGDSLIRLPFLWYGKLFLRISHAVSRRQELGADALAARVVGSRPLVEGLKKARVAAAAYDAYWSQEIVPVLRAGFLPPIADGFGRFTAHAGVSKALDDVLQEGLRETRADPYDTHPPLAERIAAVSGLPAGPAAPGDPPAISLLADVAQLERSWLATVVEPSHVHQLEPLAWDAVVETALVPSWREKLAGAAPVFDGARAEDLARVVAESRERAARLPGAESADPEERAGYVRWLAGIGLALALQRAGWTLEAPPGAPVSAHRGGTEVRPFDLVARVADGSLDGEAWRAEAERLGLRGAPLVG